MTRLKILMDKNFLTSIAQYIVDKHKSELGKLNIIVPNIRAGLYLRRALSGEIKSVAWSPRILSVQDFFHQISGLQTEEHIPLIFELYQSFRRVCPKLFDSFDAFYPWGEVILSDFNDIDSNLAEAKQVFANVADLKNIDLFFANHDSKVLDTIRQFWAQVNETDSNVARQRFLQIWQQMLPVYQDFKTHLKSKGIGYEGMIFRDATDSLSNKLFPETKDPHYFIGFNVLSRSEMAVFRYYRNQHEAKFFWQYDEKLLKNVHHEAFRFIRKYIQEFPPPKDFNYHNQSLKKKIYIYPVPSKSAQVKFASEIVSQRFMKEDPDLESSAIVLPDESLLQPILFSIPDTVEQLNVSMGFPINFAPQSSVIRALTKLQENYGNGSFYHKDVLRFINHPLVRALDIDTCNLIKKTLIEKRWLRVPQNELQSGHAIFASVFQPIEKVSDAGAYFARTLRIIYENLVHNDSMEFDREIVYQMYRRVNRFNEYLVRDSIHFQNLKTYLHLQNSMLNAVSVSFSGEPMRGLQVLGVLETRLLDFDRLMILSMNEGHFPAQSFKKSFIPYNLRKAFNLPTIELQDSMYAYYFYRMIMQASELHLLYNTADEGFMKGEKSRYIQQLLIESDFEIEEVPLHIRVEAGNKKNRSVKKDKHAMSILKQYLNGGGKSFSPSQLNTYLHCSMAFYFKYILGVREDDELVEQVGALELGNVIHTAMEFLYQPYLNKTLSASDIENLIKDKKRIGDCVATAWKEHLGKDAGNEIVGLNALALEAIKTYIHRILRLDADVTPLKYLGGEVELSRSIDIKFDGEQVTALLKGSIDHLDVAENAVRIIDYKTGKTKKADLKALDLAFQSDRNSNFDHAFQVLFYAYLFNQQPEFSNCSDYQLFPKILYTKEGKIAEVEIQGQTLADFKTIEPEWVENMQELLQTLFSADVPFTMTEEQTHCKNCPFQTICF